MITMGGGPPEVLTDFVSEQVGTPEIRAYLYRQGERIGDTVAGSVLGAGRKLLPGAAKPPGAPPSPWVGKVVSPILAPVQAGAAARVKTRLGPVVLGGALALVGLGFVLGRASR